LTNNVQVFFYINVLTNLEHFLLLTSRLEWP
jgi:hypothetical protein